MKRRKKAPKKHLYGTGQLAAMLGVEPWRIKNLTEGARYGLAPSGGTGKRRRFTFEDVFRFALAYELVRCGFAPDAVGAAVREVPEAFWRDWGEHVAAAEADAPAPFILFQRDGKWSLKDAAEARAVIEPALEMSGSDSGLFVLNLVSFCEGVFRDRIEPYMMGGQRWYLMLASRTEKGERHD